MNRDKLALKSITQLKKIFWKYKSIYVRRKARGVCFICGNKDRWQECQAGHFYHSKRFDLSSDEVNIQCSCLRCNNPTMMGGNLAEYAYKIIMKYGAGEVIRLHDLKQGKEKVNNTLRDKILDGIEDYKARVKKLDEEGYE